MLLGLLRCKGTDGKGYCPYNSLKMEDKMNKKTFCVLITLWVILLSFNNISSRIFQGKAIKRGFWEGKEIEYLDREIMFKVRNAYSLSKTKDFLLSKGFKFVEPFDELSIGRIDIPEGEDLFMAIENLKQKDFIDWAEPTMICHMNLIPNDQYFGKQWG